MEFCLAVERFLRGDFLTVNAVNAQTYGIFTIIAILTLGRFVCQHFISEVKS